MQSNGAQAQVRLELSNPARILSVSDSIISLTGFSASEWLSCQISLQDRVHPDDTDLCAALLSCELLHPSGSIGLRIRHADEGIRCLHANFTKTLSREGNSVILDLELEEGRSGSCSALDSIAASFAALMNHTDEYMYIKDRRHSFVSATRSMSDVLGEQNGQVQFPGKTGYDLYSKEMADQVYRRDQQVLREGRSSHAIQRLQLANGSHRWIDNRKYPIKTPEGETIGIFGICPDITEAIDAEHKLRESREVFQLFIEHAPAALAMLDRDMHYLAVSRRWREDFGLGSQPLVGRSHYDLFPEIPDRWKVLHRRALAGEVLYCDEDRFVREDFTMQWLRWEIHPWRNAEEAIGGLLIFTEDITQERQDREKLTLAASVFTNAREGILICDPQGAILDVNEMFTRITGYSRAEVLGRNPRILKSGKHTEDFYRHMWRALSETGQWSGEVWNKAKDGRIFPETLTISAVYDRGSSVRHYVALFSDLTQTKEHERQLEHRVHFDALTNLPNRVLLADRLQQAMAHAKRSGHMLAVACLDLDAFRVVNDDYGNEAGDRLLMSVARRMKQALRETDTLARIGGDEFVAVVLDLPDTHASKPVLNSLLACAAQPELVGDATLKVSASIGVVFYPQQEEIDADQLLRQADQAMYQAKLAGKNRYHIFDPEQDISIRSFHEDLDQIHGALLGGEFVLHYQPRVNMSTGEVVSAEALLRWRHPTRGYLLPDSFLPVIENNPLIDRVGEWVIEQVLEQLESWHAGGLRIPISVNIAAHHLQQPDFVDRLRTLLAGHPVVRPSWLELEVLETSALRDVAHVTHVLTACRELGVSIALDDFGTGYSSLSYFKRLPINTLKIDRSFIRDVLADPEDLSILEGVLGLATAFDRVAIAEGVETVDHGRLLLQLGCVFGQGNGIAGPMPGEELPAWSATWSPDPAWVNAASVAPRKRTLLHAAVAHRAWVAAMDSYLIGGRRVPPPLDPHRCRFGRWLDGERKNSIGDTLAFQTVDRLHRQLHDQSEEAMNCDPMERVRDIERSVRELHQVGDSLLEQLNLLLQDAIP